MLTTDKQQTGATLIVALVIMSAVTILALSSMSDVNLELATARNTQFNTMAFNIVESEINTQIDVVNSNRPEEVDTLFQEMARAEENTFYFGRDLPTPVNLSNTRSINSSFERDIAFTKICSPTGTKCDISTSSSKDNDSIAFTKIQIRSRAQHGSALAANSDQSQTIAYQVPGR